ncbi:MAG: response regulator [Phycisphaerae bacterium]|nr:response regulator [Phycisphaerae bacterium]|tara:strand:+ start:3812 stop:4180 length:369 start_codon:yes stop_codon:yes gene_type:complete
MTEQNEKLLVVEDTFLIAMQLQIDLKSLGYSVAGPAPSVERAFKLLDRETIKAALLDVHLGNENSIPIANKLTELDIPFLFITGFERVQVDSKQFDNHMLLRKPINLEQLDTAMHKLLEKNE